MTDSASTTKMPPMMASTISWRTITATVPRAAPSARAPTSPMKTCAGWVLNHRNAKPAPAIAEQKINSSPEPGMCGKKRYLEYTCLLYTSDAADDLLCVDLGGRRI